ncbi:MAG TPA: nitrous oxide reductase family maturation protein NosD [Rhodocyclaceae bacterium]
MRNAALLFLSLALPAWAGQDLQALIDATPPQGELRLPPGRYAGPAVVTRPLTLDGQGRAVIDNGGKGTVLTLRTSGAVVRGLTLANSGASNDAMDAGLRIEGDDNLVENNRIEEVLFGMEIHQGDRNRVRGNRIVGKNLPLDLRGDAIRLWNSRGNLVEGNDMRRVRDITVANSPGNRLAGNRLEDGRYALHIVFSPGTVVEQNRLRDTVTGIVVLYSESAVIRRNFIGDVTGGGGACITFKDSGEGLVEDNDILHCATGLQANAPLSGERVLTIRRNRFAYNTIGISFYGEQGGHRVIDNRFENNLSQVVTSAAGVGSANDWRGNYWSDYQGFDRNHDGVGDTPYELDFYADRIWMEIPKTKFFANSPAFELLDFLERLAPFSAPYTILRDKAPRMR